VLGGHANAHQTGFSATHSRCSSEQSGAVGAPGADADKFEVVLVLATNDTYG